MEISIRSIFLAFLSLAILLSGCAPAATPVPPTSTLMPTNTPKPTNTLSPTIASSPTITPIPLPPDALNPKFSPDHHWVLFRRNLETRIEFWVIDTEANNEKKLDTINLDEELKARYPDGMFSLEYGWIPNVDMFFYEVQVTYGQIPPLIIDKFVLVDANSGQAIELENSSEINEIHFSPDGSQMAVATENEFYVLRTQDGRKQFTIRSSLSYFLYSLDGKYILDFTDEGILRINAGDGQQLTIPLKYTTLLPPNPCCEISPELTWISRSSFLFTSLNSDQRRVYQLELEQTPGPELTFTVWQVDLEDGTAHSIRVFRGKP